MTDFSLIGMKCRDIVVNWHARQAADPFGPSNVALYERVSVAIRRAPLSEAEYITFAREIREMKSAPTGDTITYHGEQCYSLAGGSPQIVSAEEHRVLQVFLESGMARDTDDLAQYVANPSRVVEQLEKSFPGAVDRPGKRGRPKKGAGYFIRVRNR